MSIAVRALGIAVIVMMAALAVRLLNEREQLSRNLENKSRFDKRSRLRWKMKILGSRRKLKQGRRALSQMVLAFLDWLQYQRHGTWHSLEDCIHEPWPA